MLLICGLMPRQMLDLVEAGVQQLSNPKAQKSKNHKMMHGEPQPATMVVHGEQQQHQVVLGDPPWLLMITLINQTMREVVEEVEPASSVVKKVTCQENVRKVVVEVLEYASNVETQIIWQENVQLQMKII